MLILELFADIITALLTLIAPIFKLIFFIILLLIIWIPIAVFQGYIIEHLWYWFIVPSGLRPISIYTSIGVSLIISLLTVHLIELESKKDMFNLALFWGMSQLLILGIGYAINFLINLPDMSSLL